MRYAGPFAVHPIARVSIGANISAVRLNMSGLAIKPDPEALSPEDRAGRCHDSWFKAGSRTTPSQMTLRKAIQCSLPGLADRGQFDPAIWPEAVGSPGINSHNL